MAQKKPPSLPAAVRALYSLVLPLLGSTLAGIILSQILPAGPASEQGEKALFLAGIGLISWFMGLRWYGLPGMGLRGRRPFFAGIGFAVLGWVAFFLVRFFTVEVAAFGSGITGRTFVYLLLFEAFAVQLWCFGLIFRSVAEWRGPMTAAFVSGAVFGLVAFLGFGESFLGAGPLIWVITALFYFLTWGFFYGIIRLRTGSLLGAVIVQAMQTLTAWTVLRPPLPPAPEQLNNLYLVSILFYLIFIWRLWPKQESDYRV